jgi:hypothetical protein
MKLRFASLSLLALGLMLATVSAAAQVVYSNGPINGNLYAWSINSGFVVSDTFIVNNGFDYAQPTGASFGIWLYPGDTLYSAELSITSSENGGTSYFDQTVNFNQGPCSFNQFGYNVCTETAFFNDYNVLTNGTYWLNLKNASVTNGDPVYWDENFGGPSSTALGQSLASQNSVGTIPSEAFTVFGVQSYATNSTTTTGTVPEPSSIMLIASGVLGLAGMLRRKLF